MTVDGEAAEFEAHKRKDLVVLTPVTADERYVAGRRVRRHARPIPAPTTRSDFSTNGWTITADRARRGPCRSRYGAFTWYPVNDQPADKALYDFTISVPSPWTGIANGELTSESEEGGLTHDDVAPGRARGVVPRDHRDRGLHAHVQHLVERRRDLLLGAARRTSAGHGCSSPPRTRWTGWRQRLGPYPFDTLGFVLVDSSERHGDPDHDHAGHHRLHDLDEAVLLHEMAHHWYGDEVTPSDWRDMWMNEGMAMYLQGMWEAEHAGIPIEELMDEWAALEVGMRAESGPPGDYDPAEFGEGNVYYGPALMWHELREMLGDDAVLRDDPRVAGCPRQLQPDPGGVPRLGRGVHRRGAQLVLRRLAARARPPRPATDLPQSDGSAHG